MRPSETTDTQPQFTPPAGKGSWWTGWWQIITRFDRDKLAPWIGLRNAIGVALPLGAGILFGAPRAGLLTAIGALNVSFSDGEDPYAQRARRMLVSSIFVAIAVLAGALCGENHAVAVAVSAAWAFAAGMLVALGSPAADIGLISLVTLVVFSAEALPLEQAVYASLLAFGGGLLQMAFALALWPVRRYEPERHALGELYFQLARTALSPAKASQAPPASVETSLAHTSLAGLGRDHSIEGERYRSLLNQAERIRLCLMAVARLRVRIARENQDSAEAALLDRALHVSGEMLMAIADALRARLPTAAAPYSIEQLTELSERLRHNPQNTHPALAAMAADARHQVDALAGQLRAALDLAAYATAAGRAAFERRESAQPWHLRLAGALATLRANLSVESAAFRHAVRLAMCVAAADAVGRGLDWRRSYWLPMTVVIILKPDFTATFSRGVLRLAGTFVGLALATALFHLVRPAPGLEVLLIAALMFVARCYGPANYGVFVTAITGLVVVMFALTESAPKDVIAPRALNTLAGGAIALLAYWLWPTWERAQIPEAMARMLDAYRDYFRAVRRVYEQPEAGLEEELGRARVAARRGRSNLEASIDRLAAEPGTPPQVSDALTAMLASSHRLVHAIMALEAGLLRSRPAPARDAIRRFADDVEKTLYYLSAALRGSRLTARDLPDLREDHYALIHSGDSLTERYALVNVETDRITNSLNTLSEQILRWIPGRNV